MQSSSNQDINNEINWARNSVKHHNPGYPEALKINLELESFLVIQSAIENYQRLKEIRTKQMVNFFEGTREYG